MPKRSAHKKQTDKVPLKEAAALNWRAFQIWWELSPRFFISTTLFALVSVLAPYAELYLSALILNELSGARDPQALLRLAAVTLALAAGLALLKAGLSRWKNACSDWGIQWFQQRSVYTQKLLSMDFSKMDDAHTHDLLSQIRQNDQWSGWGLARFTWAFEEGITAVLKVGGGIALTVSLFTLPVPAHAGELTALNHPLFVVLVIGLLLAVTFLAPLLANKAERYWVEAAGQAKFGNRCFNFFGMFPFDRERALDLRIYRQERFCIKKLMTESVFCPGSPIARVAKGPMSAYRALGAAVSVLFTGLVYVFVCLKAWAGAFGVGSIAQYVGAVTALSGGLSDLVSALGSMRNNAAFLRTTFEFLDIPNEMYRGSLPVEKRAFCEKGDNEYEIEFRNVGFQYPGSSQWALRHVSLKFTAGERLAVVGRNGSGKTTFIKLLCRLYDPTEGEILLNGIDIRKYQYDEYQSIFSVVFQDFQLLSVPLGENVAARAAYDPARAEACLEKAGFDGRLAELPEGLDTCLYKDFDEQGVEISGGEAQKIALARALYKEAPYIVLDEPTAALDPVAEFEVYAKFDEIVEDKTAIYISHRLSSCRFCSRILVFDQGGIVQQGSHEQLVADVGGKYHALWHAQAQYYAKPEAEPV